MIIHRKDRANININILSVDTAHEYFQDVTEIIDSVAWTYIMKLSWCSLCHEEPAALLIIHEL